MNELLREVEGWRRVPELIVMAATNSLDALDPAVIRPGRFDRHIRVDLPDAPARAAIFGAALKGRPLGPDVDLARLAVSAEGPAAIVRAVEAASLVAFKESTGSGEVVEVTAAHLRTALQQRGGTDRPLVEDWTWDKLILPAATKAELQQVVAMVKNPELARALGVEPPTGLLLTGPPGTGKVLAAQAGCSFHPITGAEVTSPWLGESERSITRLLHRARENQSSIIFLDEIDAIAGKRGEWGGYDSQANQLLAEIDGVGSQRGLYKEHGRVRIQVLTHSLTPEEVERLEDELAEAIGAEIIGRLGPEAEADEPAHEHPEQADRPAERVEAQQQASERRREPEPPRG